MRYDQNASYLQAACGGKEEMRFLAAPLPTYPSCHRGRADQEVSHRRCSSPGVARPARRRLTEARVGTSSSHRACWETRLAKILILTGQ